MSGIGETVLYVEDPDAIPREATVLEVHAYHDSGMPKAYKLRINTGFRQAGCIVSAEAEKVFPKLPEEENHNPYNIPNMEHHEQEHEVPHEEIPEMVSENRMKSIASIAFAVIIVIGSILYFGTRNGAEKEVDRIVKTRRLNEINLLDSRAIQAKVDADSDIASRAAEKKKLIEEIGY